VFVATIDWIEASAVATALLAIATFAFVGVAALQQRDGKRSAAAAQRAAEASESAVSLQREMWEIQSRLATYPALAFDFEYDDNYAYIVVSNSTDLPSFDLDIHVVATFFDETLDPADFERQFVEPDERGSLTANEDGEFGVYDHLCYAHISPHRAVRAPINSPLLPQFLHVLAQFRDVLGRNYCRLYVGGQSMDAGSAKYTFGMYTIPEEETLVDVPRLGLLGHTPDFQFPSQWPVLEQNFGHVLAHSVAPGHLMSPMLEIEERGEWTAA
jgi:hypothetical protein